VKIVNFIEEKSEERLQTLQKSGVQEDLELLRRAEFRKLLNFTVVQSLEKGNLPA